MKTKPEFGRRGWEKKTEKNTERKPTTMERLMNIGRRWWPGERLSKSGQASDTPRVKLSKSSSLPQRRP
jgi:hypothetical protein